MITLEKAILVNLSDFIKLVLHQRQDSDVMLQNSQYPPHASILDSYEDILKRIFSREGFIYQEKGDDKAGIFFYAARVLICSDDQMVSVKDASLWNYVLGVLRSGVPVTGKTTFSDDPAYEVCL